jgi:ATP-binding cassette subfamily F protein 3
MISIQFSNVSLILGARAIFRDLNWSIQHDQKIGLVGPNGAGKSSLLRLITGEYTPEPGGGLTRARGVTTGYLPQDVELEAEANVYEVTLAGNPRWREVQHALEHVETRMADPQVYANPKALTRAVDEQARLLEEYSQLGGESYPERAVEILCGLGLTRLDLQKSIRQLSGGQKKLVGLARLLLSRPAVLLLDEPDNHLDLDGKVFLEGLIRDYPGAVVLVSHDRYLLDAVVTHIAEIEDGRLTLFSGDYSSFIADKELRLARQEELFQIQQREIARLEMARKRYALWVQINDGFASRLHAMEARLARIERIDRPVLERRRMALDLGGWQGSNKVLELIDVEKRFHGRPVLQGLNALVRHGDRVGVVGANGAGKSVLLRLILGAAALENGAGNAAQRPVEMPDLGEVRIGPSIKIGYYAQEHETLNPEMTLLDTVRRASAISEPGAVAFLNRFLFPYPRVSQKVKELSGGERSRLQLALLVLSGANFLLLDEPTNNLDIASAEVLENSLADFVGTVLVISHDRYFLDRTVDRIWALENRQLREYFGGYSDSLAQRRGQSG